MSFNDRAYQNAKRHRRRAEGRCLRCGDPLPEGAAQQHCTPCLDVMTVKRRHRQELARLGAVVLPTLEDAVRSGQPVWLSPSQSKKLLQAMEASR